MKRIAKYFRVLLLFPLTGIYGLFGQSITPIQTDRPDQTESPYTVLKNHFQIETGLVFEKVSSEENNYLYPTMLWKYGVNDVLELRIITELTSNVFNEVSTAGINPVKIGFKTKLWQEKGILPMTSFLGHLSIPGLATQNFKTTYYAPDFLVSMQHTLASKSDIGCNFGAKWDGETSEPTFLYSLATSYEISEKIGSYIELYGFLPQNGRADHRMDFGITYLLQPNISFDLSGGFGLTENAPKYFTSLGFSIRLPN